jgi:N-acetylmuramoyl-L-alanine amidase
MPGSFVIDPGHGGLQQRGKSSAGGECLAGGLLEKDVNLAVAQRVARYLGRAELTRSMDENRSIGERLELARRAGAMAFVSLHANPRESEVLVHDRAHPSSIALASALARVRAAAPWLGPAPVTIGGEAPSCSSLSWRARYMPGRRQDRRCGAVSAGPAQR